MLSAAFAQMACYLEDSSGDGGTDTDTDEPQWVDPPGTVNDGDGLGHFQTPNFRSININVAVIGAPDADVLGLSNVGGVSVLEVDGNEDFVQPEEHSERFYEDGESAYCSGEVGSHAFAWDDSTAAGFGHSPTFYTDEFDVVLSAYFTSLSISSPFAADGDGRVLLHDVTQDGCETCAIFANAPPLDPIQGAPIEGDEEGTEFGAAVAFGVFRDVDTTPSTPAVSTMSPSARPE
jgi:hypothetical protein